MKLKENDVVVWIVRKSNGEPIEAIILPQSWLTFIEPTSANPSGLFRVKNPNGLTTIAPLALGDGFYLDVRETVIQSEVGPAIVVEVPK